MKIFREIFLSKYLNVCFLLMLISGCNQLSEGLQRKKFEFLYKLNNYGALFSEYTNDVSYFKDLDFYTERMKKFYTEVNSFQTVDGYGTSRVLKENLMTTIDDNINTADN